MNKYLKYAARGLAIIISLFLVLYVIAYAYVSINKKSIIVQVTKQISEKLDGTVSIGNVDLSFIRTFPQISVLLEKVSIKDSMYPTHKHAFFTADKLYARISVFQVIAKKDPLTGIRVEDGNLYFYTDTSGYTNGYLLRKKDPPDPLRKSASKRTILDDITLVNFNIVQDDRLKEKLLDFNIHKVVCDINDRDSLLRFRTRNDILINSLSFNLDRGSFVKDKRMTGNFDVFFDERSQRLFFDKIAIKLNDHPYQLTGNFLLNKTPTFTLTAQVKKITVAEGKSLLPEKVAMAIGVVSLSKPIDVNAVISGPLKGEPLAKVDWVATDPTTITTRFFVFDNATFTGGYTNELISGLPRKDPNSRIYIHDFKGDYAGIPLRSDNIYIDDLVTPMINLDLKSDFSLTDLNNLLESNSIQMNGGSGKLDVTYSGPLTKNSNANTAINGSLNISNGLVRYIPRSIDLKNCSGSINFNKTDVSVKDFTSDVQGNHTVMNGNIKNMLSLIGSNSGKISLDWNIYSPKLQLGALTSLLQKRKNVVKTYTRKNKFGKLASQIDDMLEQSNVSLVLKADELVFKKFSATNVNASIDLIQDNWNLNNVSLASGGGTMRIKGYLRDKDAYHQAAKLNVNVDNADVHSIMNSFNDFGQDGISYANLKGKLTSDVNITMDLDRNLQKGPQNMNGTVSFSLKNGALVNYEPIKKLQNFLFKNRNFEDIHFAELKNTLEIKGREIKINRMEIQSTALTLFVEGVYGMEGNTDVSIQVPLNNLKKREADYKPENVGSDAKAGASIYLRGKTGDDGNVKFKMDLFKKFRKDDDEKKVKKDRKKLKNDSD
ncbi:MAG: hypothetical protein LH478_11225 [Chitinophagaceae bacterium]|nr:hypothetical protein [Chitinophagaceae bacterium]